VSDRGQAMKPIRRPLKSAIPKRSIIVGGNKTSISLEDEFWEALREIAKERQTTLQDLFTQQASIPDAGMRICHQPSGCLFLLTSEMSMGRELQCELPQQFTARAERLAAGAVLDGWRPQP
jgi:Ribbon-helix-helix domain